VVSPFNLHQFACELQSHPDRSKVDYVLSGIAHSFDIGFLPQFPVTSGQKNKASAIAHPEIVDAYLQNEVALGRVAGPFLSSPLPNLHVSSFGVIPKAGQPGKWRLILDLSSPHGRSVNDGIDPEQFSLQYIKFDKVAAMVTKLGWGALMAKFDVQSAYRNIAVLPSEHHLLGMKWQGKLYVDLALPFGLHSAPDIFNSIADCHLLHPIRLNLTWSFDQTCSGGSSSLRSGMVETFSFFLLPIIPITISRSGDYIGCRRFHWIWRRIPSTVVQSCVVTQMPLSIAYKEFFPVVIAAHLWGIQWANRRVCFQLDNTSVVHILNLRTSRDTHIMALLRSLLGVAACYNFTFAARHIPGVANPIADALSRFNWQVFRQLAPNCSSLPTPLPAILLHQLSSRT
jgi:hypothetical protein